MEEQLKTKEKTNDQNTNDQNTNKWLYALLGRSLCDQQALDNWQITPFLQGKVYYSKYTTHYSSWPVEYGNQLKRKSKK